MKNILYKIKYLISNIFLIFLVVIGFLYRVCGLSNNYSFWTDENHVAIFSRAIIERGSPVLANGFNTGIYQWLLYWFGAGSMKIFGINEFSLRFPIIIFGVATILGIYLLGEKLFSKKVGLLSAFLVTFLNIEILLSRQARPYQALQFFFILGAYYIYKLLKEDIFNWYYFFIFLGCGIFASLMHGLGLVIFFCGFIYLLIFKTSWFRKKWMLLGISLFVLFALIFRNTIFSVFYQVGKINNYFYYRVFLTHNYLLLFLLAVLGSFLLFYLKNYRKLLLFVIFLGVQIIIVSFFWGQPFTRYFYPVFPFIILLASYGVLEIGNCIPKILKCKIFSNQSLISLFLVSLVIFFLWKTGKLSLLPKKVYSLNADMQEIPEVDWKKIYSIVGQKLRENPEAVLITNWNDTPVWFLGEGKLNYLIRKSEQDVDVVSGAKYLNSLEKFVLLTKGNPKGYFIVDSWDPAVPEGVREYCQGNLKKEFEIDRLYPVQPRYWPVSVYSWGMD